MPYSLRAVSPRDQKLNVKIDCLLEQEGIQRDRNLDYTCALVDDLGIPVATGSCFGNTLRCFAVDSSHQGEGLLNQIMCHLMEYQMERGNTHLFLYTKIQTAKFFGDVGFHEIARVADRLVFLENRKNGFAKYLRALEMQSPTVQPDQKIGAVILNANPFTLGHLYLIEESAKHCDLLHVFVVSEDISVVPFSVRLRLIREGTLHLKDLVFHHTGPYLISSAIFPSYFLKDEMAVSESHAQLDTAIFSRIAEKLHISCRFMGEELASRVTGIYNRVMAAELPRHGIDCVILPRKSAEGQIISASTVRQMIHDGRLADTKPYLPAATWGYLNTPEAEPVIRAIQNAGDVIHH